MGFIIVVWKQQYAADLLRFIELLIVHELLMSCWLLREKPYV